MRPRDVLAAIALACLGLVLYLGLARPEFLRRIHGTLQDEPETETVRLELLPSLPVLLKDAKAGDFQTGPSGRLRAELTGILTRKAPELPLERGRLPEEVNVAVFRITAKRGPDGILRFGSYVLKPGSHLRFDPRGYTLDGLILSVSVTPERGS